MCRWVALAKVVDAGVDALVIDRRWAWAVALIRSSAAAEVHANFALAEAERRKGCNGKATQCQIGRIRMQWS